MSPFSVKYTKPYIFFNEISLDDGLKLLSAPRGERLVKGREVSLCSGAMLFLALEGSEIKCWKCGCVADRWVLMLGPNDLVKSKPVLNLFAYKHGRLVMMNRDHIIPKSVGGMDTVKNLRPACEDCNGNRGNALEGEELEFAKAHPELIHKERQERGLSGLYKSLARLSPDKVEEIEKLKQPFIALGIIA